MSTILLLDFADTKLTSETSSFCEGIAEEYGFPVDDVVHAHLTHRSQLAKLPKADVVVVMGAEALRMVLPDAPPLKKMAGALTYHAEMDMWVLPTMHPNCVYMPDGMGYNQFDTFYDHMRRAIDLCQGTLEFPPIEGHKMNWEFIGHNGTQGYGDDPKVWSGYFEATDDEIARAWQLLDYWLFDLEVDNLVFGLDTESFTVDHFKPLTMIQVYDPRNNTGYAFTWGVINALRTLWQQFFKHQRAKFVLHNTKHDRKMIKHWLNVSLENRDIDTMAYALGLTEKGNQTGLKYLSRQYCNAPFYEEGLEEWLDSDKAKINYGHIRPDVLAEYGCLDVFYTHSLSLILPPLVEREGTTNLVHDILLPAQRAFSDIEYTGILVDQPFSEQLQKEWQPLIDAAIKDVQNYAKDMGFPRNPDVVKGQVVRELCDCVPVPMRAELESVRCTSYRKHLHDTYDHNPECDKCNKRRYIRTVDDTLNVHSPKQMQHFCFDVLGMDETYEGRKTNKYFWKLNPAHEFTQLVMAYRQLDYLNTNIITGFKKFIRDDGRIHPNFWLSGTVTGRLSASEPAVHGIPKHGAHPKRLRKAFKPDPGHVLVDCDYANLELYMAHHLTNDEKLLKALQKDLHRTTAAAMYMKEYEEVTDAERQSAKPVNFGAGYNIGPGKLSRDINLIKITGGQKSKAQEFLDAFWNEYQTWNEGRLGWVAEAFENCELRTETGRVRRWNLITGDNAWKVENQACNFKGQSLASDLCLTSVVRLQDQLTKREYGRVMLTVHDSIVYSIKAESLHEAVDLIQRVMTDPVFETKTPFRVDVQVGRNYGETHSYSLDCPVEHVMRSLVSTDEDGVRHCSGCDNPDVAES